MRQGESPHTKVGSGVRDCPQDKLDGEDDLVDCHLGKVVVVVFLVLLGVSHREMLLVRLR